MVVGRKHGGMVVRGQVRGSMEEWLLEGLVARGQVRGSMYVEECLLEECLLEGSDKKYICPSTESGIHMASLPQEIHKTCGSLYLSPK